MKSVDLHKGKQVANYLKDKCPTTLLSSVFAVGFFVTSASALEQWRCTTEDFSGFNDSDIGFIERNLRKQFLLTVTETEVLVKMSSPDFEGSEERYFLYDSDLFRRYALGDSRISFDVMVLPQNPQDRIFIAGFFNVSISIQSESYANSWLLRCVE